MKKFAPHISSPLFFIHSWPSLWLLHFQHKKAVDGENKDWYWKSDDHCIIRQITEQLFSQNIGQWPSSGLLRLKSKSIMPQTGVTNHIAHIAGKYRAINTAKTAPTLANNFSSTTQRVVWYFSPASIEGAHILAGLHFAGRSCNFIVCCSIVYTLRCSLTLIEV